MSFNHEEESVQWTSMSIPNSANSISRCGHGSFADENQHIVLIGGKDRENLDISKLRIEEGEERVHLTTISTNSIQNNEKVGCYQESRFGFADAICSEEEMYFMHGGFDSNFNHSGSRFLLTSSPEYGFQCLPSELNGPTPRGYHSAVYHKEDNGNAIYIFGGQCCMGGPYSFFNDVFRLDLNSMAWRQIECSGDQPSPRSQCFIFIYRNQLYAYGGYDGVNIYTDLHRLDLASRVWSKVSTSGNQPLGLKALSPLDFHIYFCQPKGLVIGKRLVLLVEQYDTLAFNVYTLNLKSFMWRRLQGKYGMAPELKASTKKPHRSALFNPPARGNPSLSLLNNNLYVIGGHPRDPEKDRKFNNPIWVISLPKCMNWEKERLLWLACYKNNREECNLAKCPPHVIYHIIGYVNSNTFNLH